MIRSTYSQKLKDALDELRPVFRDVGQSLATLTKKRAEIAPVFIRAYRLWQRETGRSQLAFIHELDPTVPVNDRDGYRNHGSYRCAQYILGLAEKSEATKRKGLTPLALTAVAIKSFLPMCRSQREQKDALQAILAASKWRDVDQRRLLAAIRRARPVALPNVPRLVDANKATKAVVVAFERERMTA